MTNPGLLAAVILQTITERYVVNELAIPENVLKLKDETMRLYEKSRRETNADILGDYSRRLSEIKDALDKGE